MPRFPGRRGRCRAPYAGLRIPSSKGCDRGRASSRAARRAPLAGSRRRSGRPRPMELAHGSPSSGMWRSLLVGRAASRGAEAARPGQAAALAATGAADAPRTCESSVGAQQAARASSIRAREGRRIQVGKGLLRRSKGRRRAAIRAGSDPGVCTASRSRALRVHEPGTPPTPPPCRSSAPASGRARRWPARSRRRRATAPRSRNRRRRGPAARPFR